MRGQHTDTSAAPLAQGAALVVREVAHLTAGR